MATVTTEPLEALEQSWYEPPGLISWFTTVDHKRIGMKYLVTALAFFVFGGIESLILRAQLGGPGQSFSYRDLAALMIKESDNTASYVLGQRLGLDSVQRDLEKLPTIEEHDPSR